MFSAAATLQKEISLINQVFNCGGSLPWFSVYLHYKMPLHFCYPPILLFYSFSWSKTNGTSKRALLEINWLDVYTNKKLDKLNSGTEATLQFSIVNQIIVDLF